MTQTGIVFNHTLNSYYDRNPTDKVTLSILSLIKIDSGELVSNTESIVTNNDRVFTFRPSVDKVGTYKMNIMLKDN